MVDVPPHSVPVPELLAPAGSPAAFWAALAGGADAVYCALGSDFNARRGADNFDDDGFAAACRAAHLAGARVFVTMNVVVREDEMGRALALARRAWELGADALIVQDWGLLSELRRLWPEVELHVSTQANVHDRRGVAWCRSLGAERVTLSRELPLDEIALICAQEAALADGCELEVFGHGALCFCYSGVCLMSSMRALTTGVRSANRGLCAQPCRLPYDLVDEGGAVLSAPGRPKPLCPKDACSVRDLPELCAAGVASLKLEGRMKAPDYVLSVASAYRAALDAVAAGREPDERAALDRLRRSFNRDLTDAYLRGTSGDEMMSYERSNNRGLLVGRVTASRPLRPERAGRGGSEGGRRRGRQVTPAETSVALDEPVAAGDLLEIRPVGEPEQFLTAPARADAAAGDVIEVRTARPMEVGSLVRVIRTQAALDAAARCASRVEAGGAARRRPVGVRVSCRLGEPLSVELSCDGVSGGAEGPLVEPARTRELDRGQLVEHVGRMGSSPFEPRSFEVELDPGCGMRMADVHATRAAACEALERALLAPWEGRRLAAPVPAPAAPPVPRPCDDPEVCALARDAASAGAALSAGASRVYAHARDLARGGPWPEGVVPVLPEVCREPDRADVDPWVRPGAPVAVGNVSELALARESGAAAEVLGCVPVHNVAAARMLAAHGACALWLSPEVSLPEMGALCAGAGVSVGVSVYGRQRVMTSEHCVLQVADACVGDCARCALRRRRLFLRDERGRLMPVETDERGRSRIWLAERLDAVPEVPELLAAGVGRLLVDGTLLGADEVARQVRRVATAVRAARGEGRVPARERGAGTGHLRLELA